MVEKGVTQEEQQCAPTSVRARDDFTKFTSEDVSEQCLEHVLELGRLAPSEWNFQPWRWVIVRSGAGKRHLQASTYLNVPWTSAPVVFICLADTLAWKTAPQRLQEMVANKRMTEEEARDILGKIREHYSASPEIAKRAALANAFVAMHQILEAAADCDLSAYWVTEFDEQKIKTYFHIPDQFLVAALLAMGHREKTLSPVPKLPIQSLVYGEKFGEAFKEK